MTKMFEEVYAPATEPVTIANNANQALHKNHREWREAFHAVKAQNKELRDEIKEFERENQRLVAENMAIKTSLEEAKKQPKVEHMDYCEPQALPVVPVLTQKQADILNDYKNGSGSLAIYLLTEIKKGDYDYFARAWLDGYTVEKPKTLVSPCPVCGYKDVSSNFCSICGHKNEHVEDGE